MNPPRNCVYANPLRIFLWMAPIAILALSALWHWLYDWIPHAAIGVVAPVAESVWEHGKIVWYPTLVYWGMAALVCRAQCPMRLVLTMGVLSAMVATDILFALYYVLHAALGVGELLWVDIVAEALALAVANALGAHALRHAPMPNGTFVAAFSAAMVVCAIFGICTFFLPQAPLFARL